MAKDFPVITSERLILRRFTMDDQEDLYTLVSNKEVAATTLRIPHPCSYTHAAEWLSKHTEEFDTGKTIRWAISLKQAGQLIGGISLFLNQEFESAEIGYWIGRPYWGNGYARETATQVIDFGFHVLKLNRIEAHLMTGNESSAKILEKLGMRFEGLHRQLIKKWGEFKDVQTYAVLRADMD